MNAVAAARAGAEPTRVPEPRLFYLAQDDRYESQIAKAWAKEHKRSVVHWIPLDRLTLEMVIVPVVRTAETRTFLEYEEWSDSQHKKVTLKRKPEELTGEMVECMPVRVSEFWRGSGGRGGGNDPFAEMLMGELDKPGFIEALNQSTAIHSVYPRTHHGDDGRVLKLTWGA